MWKMCRIRCGEKSSKSAVLFCPSVCLEEFGKITEILSRVTWLLGSFMKLRFYKYEESLLTVWPQCFLKEGGKKSLKFSRRYIHVFGSDALSRWREFRMAACCEKMATAGRLHVTSHMSRS
jgi:hypothetical protein